MSPEPSPDLVIKKIPDKVDVANASNEKERFELSLQMLQGKLKQNGPNLLRWKSHKAAREAEGRWDLEREK
jgi:hypothetical protein